MESTIHIVPQDDLSGLPMGMALRQAMGECLTAMGHEDASVLVLDADVASSTGAAQFEATHPRQFVQTGIAEQNMLGMAAGLATLGYRPFVTAFAAFAVTRALDSIRVLIAQPELNVKVLGGYAGLLTGRTGKTHQVFNDLAIMRSMPNMIVAAPADEHDLRSAIRVVGATNRPAYIQVTRDPSPLLFSAGHRFEIGKAVVLRDGAHATVVSTGVQTTRVCQAAAILAARGISVRILHMATVKPIDVAALVDSASSTGHVITVEEQDVAGGLGGAVAEVLSELSPTRVTRLGIRDSYGESGANEDLLDKYRLSPHRVAHDIEEAIVLRRRADGSETGPLGYGV